jgi:hypothetical protein
MHDVACDVGAGVTSLRRLRVHVQAAEHCDGVQAYAIRYLRFNELQLPGQPVSCSSDLFLFITLLLSQSQSYERRQTIKRTAHTVAGARGKTPEFPGDRRLGA